MEYKIEELLKQINELTAELNAAKKYGLVWDKESVPEKVVQQCVSQIPVLEMMPHKKIEAGANNNILIEGDNYHSLVSLNMIIPESVDVIYIDPPYNTEHKDFIYNDSFVNLDDEYRHSKWLNFMSKRLQLARSLLKPDGVLLMSIDDHEMAQLRILGDSIFGDYAFVTTIHVELSATQGMKVKAAQNGNVVKNAEYILVYSKDGHKNIGKHLLYDYRPYDSHYNKIIKDGKLYSLKEAIQGVVEPHYRAESLSSLFDKSPAFRKYIEMHLSEIVADDKITGFNMDDFKVGIPYEVTKDNKQYLLFNNGKKLRQLLRLSDSYGKCNDFYESVGMRKIRGDWWKDFYLDMGNVSKEGDVVFENGKKPVRLIEQLLYMTTDSDSLVLDFFAGSGTTGHAVLSLNKKDGGKRRFILCTNNENGICENITYTRLNNVIHGTYSSGEPHGDALPANLYYFKTNFMEDMANTEQAKYSLVERVDELLCIKEDIFVINERNEYSSHYSNGDNHLFIYNDYFNMQKFDEFKKRVLETKGQKTVYVYSSDNNVDETLFKDMDVVLKPIPSKIYEIYKEIVEGIKRGD